MTIPIKDILRMPTIIDNPPHKTHESVYRAYHLLQYAKGLLERGVPSDAALVIVQQIEDAAQARDEEMKGEMKTPSGRSSRTGGGPYSLGAL